MKKLATSVTKSFIARFSPESRIQPFALRYLAAKTNPITPKIEHMCNVRDRNTLWWRVTIVDMVSYKSVVRSWAARRARAAFKEELKARGFDSEGRRLASETSGSAATSLGFSGNMTGTLNMDIQPAILTTTFPALLKEMKFTVDALIREQQQMQTGRKKSPQNESVKHQPRQKLARKEHSKVRKQT
ncbi:hypothetical protein BDW74DRAFT_154367 [Aspergillus multicolor]|uniref:uncharacterized protein n=1 Tax=Aspergillus multicolor TaxID=41759 RepID=UPI003CCD3FC0